MVGAALLVIHIIAGSVALATAAVALITAKGGVHHIRAGRVYATAMALVCVSALPLALLGSDVVLLLVAVFSSYLVFAGWRFARNRSGGPQMVDWAALAAMGLTGLGMWGYGATLFLRGDAQWVTMAVFGAIAVALSAVDLRYHRRAPVRPATHRAASHQHAGRDHRHRHRRRGGQRRHPPGMAGLDSPHYPHHPADRLVESAGQAGDELASGLHDRVMSVGPGAPPARGRACRHGNRGRARRACLPASRLWYSQGDSTTSLQPRESSSPR